MSDLVTIRHPDHPGVTSRVTRSAFERRSVRLGWQLVGAVEPPAPPAEDEKTALTRRLEAAGVTVDGRWGIKRLRIEAAKVDARDEDFDE